VHGTWAEYFIAPARMVIPVPDGIADEAAAQLIAGLAVLSALLLGGVLGMAIKARRRALVSGDAGLVGSLVTVTQVRTDNPFCGSVQAQGEQWQAQCATPLQPGQHVRVTARNGVTLEVSATAPTAPGE